ncbi:hypothetical protein ACICHK_00370 [Streptomyces sp. AHU1]|uniref:hypothetical protein n=1 Tax=Streptomyces sp. AHU1 TaxID=3377215 RepID=UPI0038782E6C
MNPPEQRPTISAEAAVASPPASTTALLPVTVDKPLFQKSCHLTANVGAGPNARLRVRTWLTVGHWSGDIDKAARIADKLVDNAVRHGKPLPDDRVALRVIGLADTGELVIEVEDALSDFPGFEEVAHQAHDVQETRTGLWWVAHYHGRLFWDVMKDVDGLVVGKTVQALLPVTWKDSQ